MPSHEADIRDLFIDPSLVVEEICIDVHLTIYRAALIDGLQDLKFAIELPSRVGIALEPRKRHT